jgi:hypothetical protein
MAGRQIWDNGERAPMRIFGDRREGIRRYSKKLCNKKFR